MASTGKSRKKGTASRGKPRQTGNTRQSTAGRDFLLIAVIIISVVLLMSALGFGGIVGNVISQVMFGAMGYVFYAMPAALPMLAYMIIGKRFAGRRAKKVISLLVLLAAVCGLVQYVTEGVMPGNSLLDYYAASSLYKTGGGIIGGAVCFSTSSAFGEIGGLFVTVIAILVCVIELTYRSFFDFLYDIGDGIARIAESSRVRYEEREPERELRREIRDTEKQMRLEERKAARMQKLEERKAALDDPDYDDYEDEYDDGYRDDYEESYKDDYRDGHKDGYRDDYEDGIEDDYEDDLERGAVADDDPDYEDDYEDDYEEGPVIGERRTPARRRNPKVDRFPGNRKELDVPLYDEGPAESAEMKKARKAISRQQKQRKGGFLDGTWLKDDIPAASDETYDDDHGMRELSDDFTIERGDTRKRKSASVERVSPGASVDTWDERTDDDEGWDLDDALYAQEQSRKRKKKSAGASPDGRRTRSTEKDTPDTDDGLTGRSSYPGDPYTVESKAEPDRRAAADDDEDDDFDQDIGEMNPGMPGGNRSASGRGSGDTGAEGAAQQDVPARRSPTRKAKSTGTEIEEGIINVESQIAANMPPIPKEYVFPPVKLLKRGSGRTQGDSDAYLRATAQKLQDTLYNFGVNAKVTNVSCGPSVTRFELTPEMGVKVSKIVGLADDIKLNLACADIRIEAPIPGKSAVGIEVPNKENTTVMLRDLIECDEFSNARSKLTFAVGKDIGGKPVMADIAKMPHVLIAGATGSGKSVCINTLIMSIIYKAKPDEVKLIMIDPKVVELSVYNGIPHLLIPVVTDPKKAAGALNWAVNEMSNRYNTFAEYSVRNLKEYNQKVKNLRLAEGEERPPQMSQIIVIVDELADLMMVAPGDVEDAICRLAQLARAAGIHLVIATQRPSVNVITGLIKANMPSRIAFAVASGVDSRTILDMNGAEKLLGKGDMLFYPQGYPKPARLQGSFVSDEEVSAVVDFLKKKNPEAGYDPGIEKQMTQSLSASAAGSSGDDRDAYFAEAGKFIIEKDKASIGMLQRMFKIGFNRAARVMDQLADAGVVGPEEGTKPRKILMSMEQFENYLEQNG